MLRPDLEDEIKSIKDLKGRVVAVNAPNSIALYEVTRILETAGLTIKDVEIKVIPFAQLGVAFQTKAVDAGLQIAPFNQVLARQGLGNLWINSDETVKPSPVQISTSMYNTDWAAKNPEVAQAFFTALLRGVRDYCDAYHGGSWRPELLKLLVANGVSTSVETSTRFRGRCAIRKATCGASRCSTSSIGTSARTCARRAAVRALCR